MNLTSTAFADGAEIPQTYTCEGRDIAPPLAWHGVPPNTRSLALIVDDPDAPDPAAPKMTWVHWIVLDLLPETSGIPEGATPLPSGCREGTNDWKRARYGGPCPPIGRHRYFFKLYALDTPLHALAHPTKPELERAMKGHVIASAQLIGTYQKRRA